MSIISEPKSSDSTIETTSQAHSKVEGFSAIERQFERLKSTVPARFAEKADQVLLGLSHTGQSIPMLLKQTFNKIDGNPNDVIGRISRTVLEQAQSVRQTLATKSAQLSEIADGVSTRVKSVNPFTAEEVSSQPAKPAVKAKAQVKAKSKSKSKANAGASANAKPKSKPQVKRAKASSRTSKE